MGLFGRKKDKSDKKVVDTPVVNREELIAQAESKVQELESASGADRIKLLNEIGSLYFQAEELDQAISYYETSLSENRQMGKAYTDLMSLYNKKRQKAAEDKNEEEIKYYFGKVQEMMQMSKDMIRGVI